MKHPPLFPTYPISTLQDLVEEVATRYRDKVALATKEKGAYHTTSYLQLKARVLELSAGLAALGTRDGDLVALIGENTTEWALSYLAIVSSGRVVVPVDRDLRPGEIRHILEFSEVDTVLCSGRFVDDMVALRARTGRPCRVVSLEKEAGRGDHSFSELLERGHGGLEGESGYRPPEVGPETLAAIIFTSGTMGSSKAVMLTHGNLASNIIATSKFVSIRNDDRCLSVLPLHHTYECTCGFLTGLYQGASIYHAENLRRIPENLAEIRVTVVLGVPLLFETMYRRIEKGIREKGERKFRIAKTVASLTERFGLNIRRRLFKPVHDRLGGNLRLLITGGAAMNPEVSSGFRDLGIQCIQGYGMTEASPLIAVNREANPKDSSVGMPVPGVEARIIEGEIAVRGPSVMLGYYKNRQATAETIEDGWLLTGDLGHIDEDGFLYVSGRKKSVIVTPNGKNVYPEELEAQLNESRFIAESLVWGGPSADPDLTEVQAIIVPDVEALDEEFGASEYDDERIEKAIAAEVKQVNRVLANYKRIRKFSVRHEEFEKTTTRKIKRYLYTGALEPL